MRPVLLSLGEVLVEVMREGREVDLATPGVFQGPFASGAPAIFAWAAAQLGARMRFLGAVGDDPFGALCERHLRDAGVDVRALKEVKGRTTGVAFVRYKPDGEREFVFHIAESAAGDLSPDDLSAELLDGVTWLHVTGSSLAVSPNMRDTLYEAIRTVKAQGGKVSFDPNIRPELGDGDTLRQLCALPLEQADLVLPSGAEASLITGINDPVEACRSLVSASRTVVLKRGAAGSTLFTPSEQREVESISVEEVDPTGAGDCFAAALLVSLGKNRSLEESVSYANRVGAYATTALGPMEADFTHLL